MISPLQIARVYNHHGVGPIFSPVDLDRIDYDRHPLMRGVRMLDVVVFCNGNRKCAADCRSTTIFSAHA